jgi:hypothetical protein
MLSGTGSVLSMLWCYCTIGTVPKFGNADAGTIRVPTVPEPVLQYKCTVGTGTEIR